MHHFMSCLGTPATSQNTVALLSSAELAGPIFNILGASVIAYRKRPLRNANLGALFSKTPF